VQPGDDRLLELSPPGEQIRLPLPGHVHAVEAAVVQFVEGVEGESGVVAEEWVVVPVFKVRQRQPRTIGLAREQVEESLGEWAT
jgi:hypothetical protein